MTEDEIELWISDEMERHYPSLPINVSVGNNIFFERREAFKRGAIHLYEKLTEQHKQEIEYWKKRLTDCLDTNQEMGREGEIH